MPLAHLNTLIPQTQDTNVEGRVHQECLCVHSAEMISLEINVLFDLVDLSQL